MASMPLQVISDLYYNALRHRDVPIGAGRGYILTITSDGEITLMHYGTVIYNRTPEGVVEIGGWSVSDANAINSLVYHVGGQEVYMTNNQLYFKGEGPRYEKKATKRAVRSRSIKSQNTRKDWSIYGWDDNWVLQKYGNEYTCVDVLDPDRDWHEYPFRDTPAEILEWIADDQGWDGGGDVNIEGQYIEWYYRGKQQGITKMTNRDFIESPNIKSSIKNAFKPKNTAKKTTKSAPRRNKR